jgi:hypothetical protein
VQRLQDRKRAHRRQPILGLPQGALQRGQRPGGRPVLFPVGWALELAQNPGFLGLAILLHGSPAGLALQRREPLPVEAAHQEGHAIAGAAAGGPSGIGKASAVRHGEQDLGPFDMGGRFALGTRHLLQHGALELGQRAERFLLGVSHPLPLLADPRHDVGRKSIRSTPENVNTHVK